MHDIPVLLISQVVAECTFTYLVVSERLRGVHDDVCVYFLPVVYDISLVLALIFHVGLISFTKCITFSVIAYITPSYLLKGHSPLGCCATSISLDHICLW